MGSWILSVTWYMVIPVAATVRMSKTLAMCVSIVKTNIETDVTLHDHKQTRVTLYHLSEIPVDQKGALFQPTKIRQL